MKNPTTKAPAIFTITLYTCSLLLFLEWLYPVDKITDTSNISVFMLYTLFCFLISALSVQWWISFSAKGMGLLFVINGLFFDGSILDLQWLKMMWLDLSSNITFLIHQDWYNLTPLFRSLLFLVLIWLMSYLLYYWFVTMKYVFVFLALTVVYVSLLDTFTVYNAQFAIVRIVVISLISLGLTNLMKEQAQEGLYFPRSNKRLQWIMPIIAITFLSVTLGFLAPKLTPQWPDPVPFFESMANKSNGLGSGSSTRTVGYGEDDSTLGGSFAQDDTTVFKAEATEKQYWRIETKDVYTGKGWENSEDTSFENQGNGEISLATFSSAVESEKQTANVRFSGQVSLNKIIYPYGIQKVETDDDADLLLNSASEAIHSEMEGNEVSLPSYSLTYDEPSFDLNALKNADETDPDDIKERYTQLPDELPDRVGELAEEVTEYYSSRYDKAKAVEQYFGRNGFVYQISDVPVPDSDEDYVDQFLYDTKAGYCDNYSTSMIVMLRTLGIPSRWVKGFTGGEKVDEKENPEGEAPLDVFEVKNSNAHSWVEVYFPDIGWVPFEPTQGFSNEADFHEDSDDATDDSLDSTEGEPDEEPNDTDENEPDTGSEAPENDEKKQASKKTESTFSYWYILLALVPVIALMWYVYYKRYHIQAYFIRKKMTRKQGDAKTYSHAYLFLLKLLKHKGLEKGTDQTLREYASRIDRRYRRKEMSHLTAYYEQMVYNKQMTHVKMDDFQETWERLVGTIIAS